MPVLLMRGRGAIDDPASRKYVLPRYLGLCPEKLENARVAATRLRDDMLAYQKQCSANKDREGARFFKEEAADAMKMYRAACLLLPFYAREPRGDCPLRDLYEIGPEMFFHLTFLEMACAT